MSRTLHVGFLTLVAVVLGLSGVQSAKADFDTQNVNLDDGHTTYYFTESPFVDSSGKPVGTSLYLDLASDVSTLQFCQTTFEPFTGTAPNAPSGWFQFAIYGDKVAPAILDPLHGPRFSVNLPFGTVVASSGDEVYDKNAVIGAPGVDLWSHMFSSISMTNMLLDGQAIGGYSELSDPMSGTTTVREIISVPVKFTGPDPAAMEAVVVAEFSNGNNIPEPSNYVLVGLVALSLLVRKRSVPVVPAPVLL